MKTRTLKKAVDEAIKFGECFLGSLSFDSIEDSKKVQNYLRKHKVQDVYLVHFDASDNVRDCFGGIAEGWYLISTSA